MKTPNLDEALGVGYVHALVTLIPEHGPEFCNAKIKFDYRGRTATVEVCAAGTPYWTGTARAALWELAGSLMHRERHGKRLNPPFDRLEALIRTDESFLADPDQWLDEHLVACSPTTCTHGRQPRRPKS